MYNVYLVQVTDTWCVYRDNPNFQVYKFYRQGNQFHELCMKEEGHCKGILEETPAVLDFKPTPTESERKKKAKVEL